MQIQRNDTDAFVISEVEPPLQEILLAIPAALEPEDSAAATERLYPVPTTERDTAEICAEWREYVQPDLRHLFENAAATVEVDLEQLLETGDTLTIPANHVDAWLNALNQARLVLAARFDVTDDDMDRSVGHLLENERDFALFQIHLYGFIQECLLRGGE